MAKKYVFELKGASAARLAAQNPILRKNEPCVEEDTGKLKFGDGVTPYLSLDYFTGNPSEDPSTPNLDAHINSSTPHPVYDDGPSLALRYENAKV